MFEKQKQKDLPNLNSKNKKLINLEILIAALALLVSTVALGISTYYSHLNVLLAREAIDQTLELSNKQYQATQDEISGKAKLKRERREIIQYLDIVIYDHLQRSCDYYSKVFSALHDFGYIEKTHMRFLRIFH